MPACPACQQPNDAGAVTCIRCGRPLDTAAPTFGAVTSLDATETRVATPGATAAARASGFLAPGHTLGTRYHVIRELGVGGMGAVYQAWDAELSVAVALKMIRVDAAAWPEAAVEMERRFKRELLLARQVTHPNVVRIHDLGEIDGIKYITMPFIDGRDLSHVLRESGRLPVSRVLAIATQVASGLKAAHDVGVVHRDLKPANIMLTADDHALIMDFGIARSVAPGATSATVAGSVVGTFEYMAPEQAQGKPVDHRADIYAFGLILYDLLLGPRPQGNTPLAALMDRIQHPPPPPRSIDPQIPEQLDRIIAKCLQTDPAGRYQRTADLLADLQAIGLPDGEARDRVTSRRRLPWVAAAVIAGAATVGVGLWATRETRSAGTVARLHDPMPVLVADFANNTNDAVFEGSLEQVFALGVEGAPFITSYSRQAAQRLAAQIVPGGKLDEEGARLVGVREGIKLVLAGGISRNDSGYELSARAIDPVTGNQVAQASATARDKGEVLQAVQDLAIDVRRGLGDAAREDGDAGKHETFTAGSLAAARAYAQAQALSSSGKEKEAAALLQEAVAHDPNFGRAYAAWAVAAYRLGNREEAAQLWKRALALMDRMTERERYRTLGAYHFGVTRNYELAVENYNALLKRYPADASGLNNLGLAYFEMLDFERAVQQGQRAVSVYPKNALYRQNLALYMMYAGHLDAAVSEARRVIDANEPLPKVYLPLAIAALASDNPGSARDVYARMSKVSARGAALATLGTADLALYEGKVDEAEIELRRALSETKETSNRDQALQRALLAETYAIAGRWPQAVGEARAALRLGDFDDVTVPAAMVLIGGDQEKDAEVIGRRMEAQLQKRTRALGKLILGEIAAKRRRTTEALDLLNEAKALADLWPIRFALGRLYAEADRHAEALAELDVCAKRSSEGASMFLADVPTYRATLPLKYWLARSQQGLGLKADASGNFRAYLARREHVAADPLAVDARKRLGSL